MKLPRETARKCAELSTGGLTVNLPPAPDCPEADFQRRVIDLAEANGWRTYHVHDSRRDNPGFPDLVLVRSGVLVFAELKAAKGRLRPAQREWMADLERVPGSIRVRLWRPADWSAIVAELTETPTGPDA